MTLPAITVVVPISTMAVSVPISISAFAVALAKTTTMLAVPAAPLATALTTEMDAALDAVRVPLLAIQSTYLNSARVRVAIKPGETSPWIDLLRARVPGARIEVVTGVGHFPQLEAADRVNALVEDFCARLAHEKRGRKGFAELVGLRHVSHGAGTSRFEVQTGEEHANPQGVVHGGLAFALADTGTGSALWTLLERGEGCATIEMKISYLKPPQPGRLVCDSRVLHREGNRATIESEVRSGDDRARIGGVRDFPRCTFSAAAPGWARPRRA